MQQSESYQGNWVCRFWNLKAYYLLSLNDVDLDLNKVPVLYWRIGLSAGNNHTWIYYEIKDCQKCQILNSQLEPCSNSPFMFNFLTHWLLKLPTSNSNLVHMVIWLIDLALWIFLVQKFIQGNKIWWRKKMM